MTTIIAFICGMTVMASLVWLIGRIEWENRRRIERRVDELYEHLACSEGFLGCEGTGVKGEPCPWDHK